MMSAGFGKGKIMDEDWIKSVYFIRLAITYQAITDGYLGDWPPRKLRAVLKGVTQSISPCLRQEDMLCRKCSLKEECCFFQLMVEDRNKDYLPYLISMNNGHDWRGPISKGSRHTFTIFLIGEKINCLEKVSAGLREKKLIFLDGITRQSVGFELLSLDLENNGKPLDITNLLPLYTENNAKGIRKIERISIEFVTPQSPTYNNKTITKPKDFNFRVFLSALHKRVSGLAMGHCGFKGHIPEKSQFISSDISVTTNIHPDFKFVRKEACKKSQNGRNKVEYIGGLKGMVSFDGDITPYFPLIVLGEELHIGNDTTQGLGKYRIIQINN